MVVENNLPKTETIYEIKNETQSVVGDQIPSFEEFMKTYENDGSVNYDDLNGGSISEVKGYGPCKNSLCSCDCYSDKCICSNVEGSLYDNGEGFKILSSSASGRVRTKDKEVGGQVDNSLIRIKDFSGEARFISGSVRGKLDEDGFGVQLGVDAAKLKTDGFEASAGFRLDTGISEEDGSLEVKAAGFGVTVGKQIGVSLPFGEVKVDSDKCSIQ
jgi:hypothetical protein